MNMQNSKRYELSLHVDNRSVEPVLEYLKKMNNVEIDQTMKKAPHASTVIACSMTEDLIFDIMLKVSWLVSVDEFVYCEFNKVSNIMGSTAWVSRGLVVAHSKNGATELWEEFNKPSEDYRISVAARKKVVKELCQRRQELRKNWGIKYAPDGSQITQWVNRY